MKDKDKARGMLVGLAVGDALGAPVEFGYTSDRIRQMGDAIAVFQDSPAFPAGAWTDDTSIALCIADSLLEKHGYDSYDIMNKFSSWVSEGYRSFDGRPAFDVGVQTSNAIYNYLAQPVVSKNAEKTESAGNGAIMRLAPIVIANKSELNKLVDMAVLSCRETHNSIAAECATEMFAKVLNIAMIGGRKSDIRKCAEEWSQHDDERYNAFWKKNKKWLIDRAFSDGEELRDLGGYIVDTFAIALWGFFNSDSFEEGMMKIIRFGGDTDTNAACYGQLAGAFYGYEAIPEKWREGVCQAEELVRVADRLLEMSECPIIRARFEDSGYFKYNLY